MGRETHQVSKTNQVFTTDSRLQKLQVCRGQRDNRPGLSPGTESGLKYGTEQNWVSVSDSNTGL